jgi:hypothetical protein
MMPGKTDTMTLRTAVSLLAAGLMLGTIATAFPAGAAPAGPAPTAGAAASEAVTEAEAYAVAREGYNYLFPLLTMDFTNRAQTTVVAPGLAPRSAVENVLAHAQAFPRGEDRIVVRPNFDTLYSIAWIDVSKGPVTLAVKPDLDRYYLLPLMDMWTDVFAAPGTRTLGKAGGRFLIASRDWRGTVPDGTELIRAPTDKVWLIARIQTNSPTDYEHVRKVQQGITLTPSVPPGPPAVDTSFNRLLPPARLMGSLTPEQFFARGAELTGLYPPHDVDQPVLSRLTRIGFRPGRSYDLATQPAAVQAGVRRAVADGLAALKSGRSSIGMLHRGSWDFQPGHLGAYGGDYAFRARVALGGLGANRIEDAIYPATAVDADGQPLIGTNRYVLHFTKAELPPAGAFWSLTAYDGEGFPILTPQRRYAVGDRDPLVYNADGSLDLYIGQTPPDDPRRAANWLPTLADPFNLSLRLYLPRPEVLEGRWTPPSVTRIGR